MKKKVIKKFNKFFKFSIENVFPSPAISHQLLLPPTVHSMPNIPPLFASPRFPPLATVPIQNGRLVGPQMPPLAPKSTPIMPPGKIYGF